MVLSTILAYPTHAAGAGIRRPDQWSETNESKGVQKGLECEEARERHYWGIQTGPFAALEATFVLKNFTLFHFHTGEPILITPEG